MPRHPVSVGGSTPAPLTRVLALQLPRGRASETTASGGVRIGGINVTDGSGWLMITTVESSVPATCRNIAVHLVLEHPALPDTHTNVWVDAIRLAGIQWRSVMEFLEATGHAWGPLVAIETERAIRRATHSGVYPREP
jgi:hypothetical protein